MSLLIMTQYRRVLGVLDLLSDRIRGRSYNFEGLFATRHSTDVNNWNRYVGLEAFIVLVLLILLAVFSRDAQFSVMADSPASYFLPGLNNVSTTNDAGYYMQLAREWTQSLETGKRFWQIEQGALLGYILANVSLALDVSLEQAARFFLYFSVALTAFAAYLLLLTIGQSLLGITVACGLIFFFPVFGRTSLGMVDTDQLNLFFILATVAALIFSIKKQSVWGGIIGVFLAAFTCQIFWLWYARPGFLLVFVGTYLAMLLTFRVQFLRGILLIFFFTLFAGLGQLSYVFASLSGFLGLYVFSPQDAEATVGAASSNLSGLQAMLWSTISEITGFSSSTVINDYGSKFAFFMVVVGLVFWIFQDWRRFSVVLPFVAFFVLYVTSGQRFSLYWAPAALIGLFVCLANIFWFLGRFLRAFSSAEGFSGATFFKNSTLAEEAFVAGKTMVTGGRRLCWVSFLLICCWVGGIFPPLGVTPPPVIRAEELSMITKSLVNVPRDRAIISSWWDYGHELRYQTGFEVISDGGNPSNIKNIYLARALVSTNPLTAADEFRFAAYFDAETLGNFYPLRPGTELSNNTHRDLYLFLPSDLQDKMITVFNIASATVSKDAMRGYNSDESAFVILYHQQPKNWGPFQLVQGQKEGGVLYRLPAPMVPGK